MGKGRFLICVIVLMGVFLSPLPASAAATLEITTWQLPPAQVNRAYNAEISITGGTAPYSWNVTGLPTSLWFNPVNGFILNAGSISASDIGLHPVSVDVTDSSSPTPQTASTSIPLRVTDLDITSPAEALPDGMAILPVAIKDKPYTFDLKRTGGSLPYSWEITAGSLPKGMALDRTIGRIYGTPLELGTYRFQITLTDAYVSITRKVELTIADFRITNDILPNATVGARYYVELAAEGGVYPFSWNLYEAPNALMINSTTGQLYNGAADMIINAGDTGTWPVIINVTASSVPPLTTSISLPLTVGDSDSPFSLRGPSTRHHESGDLVNIHYYASGGTPPYTWSISGALPAGVTFRTCSGTLSGTALSTGAFPVTVTVTDSTGATDTVDTHLSISSLRLKTYSLGHMVFNYPYSQQVEVEGSSAPFTWALTDRALPAGLSLDTTNGIINGTPTAVPSPDVPFEITVTDSAGYSIKALYQIDDWPASAYIYTTGLQDAVLGAEYHYFLKGSVSLEPASYSIASGSLPAGMFLDPDTGEIYGTPASSGTSSFTIMISDYYGANTFSRPLDLTVLDFGISTQVLPSAVIWDAYSFPIQLSGGAAPYSWNVTGLPTSLWFDPVSGFISNAGSITGADLGLYTVTASVTDSTPQTVSRDFSFSVTDLDIIYPWDAGPGVPTPLDVGILGAPYSFQLYAAGGSGIYNWTIALGDLPYGLELDPYTGVISGTPDTEATFQFYVKMMDELTGQRQYRYCEITIADFRITTTSLPTAFVNQPYYAPVAVSGATYPLTWNLYEAPNALMINSITGEIYNGVADMIINAGDYGRWTVIVSVTDNSSPPLTISKRFPLFVSDVSSADLTGFVINSASGFAVMDGLSVSLNTGQSTLTGLGGDYSFTGLTPQTYMLNAIDPMFHDYSAPVDLSCGSVSRNILLTPRYRVEITTPSVPDGEEGAFYSVALMTVNGTAPYTWGIVAGAPPLNLTLNPSNGILSGTPAAGTAGAYAFIVEVMDSLGNNDYASYSMDVTAPVLPIAITTSSLPDGMAGAAYSQSMAATGGVGPYTWSLTGASLPAGVSLGTDGTLSGTPTTPGTSTPTITVTDSLGSTDSSGYSMDITTALAITTAGVGDAVEGVPYSNTLSATGGTPSYTWGIIAGSPPSGVNLSTAGVLSGTPAGGSAGQYIFIAEVTDSLGHSDTASYTMNVTAPVATLAITTSSLPDGMVGAAYSQSMAATGGVGPYTWTLTGGSLPASVSLGTDGTLSGTPTTPGTSTPTITVTDSLGSTDSSGYSMDITAALAITTAGVGDAVVGVPYSNTISATGGTPSYTWAILAGSPPSGVTLSTGGVLSGTPAGGSAGQYIFIAEVTDSLGHSDTASYTMNVTAPVATLAITTSSLPDGMVGAAYSQSMAATGGVGPYTWTLTGGSLPAGVSLGTDGTLSGTPTTPGTSTPTITVTDSLGSSDSLGYSMDITAALNITTSSIGNAVVGSAYSNTISATGGTPSYTWAIIAGAPPSGITLSTGGILSGTPATGTAGAYWLVVQVTDSLGASAADTYGMSVTTPLAITTASLPTGMVNAVYSYPLAAGGGVAPYSWSISAGALPTGITLAAGGSLSGTPTVDGSFSPTFVVFDSSGLSSTATIALIINTASGTGSTDAPGLTLDRTLRTGDSSGWCFIATAAYGSYMDADVMVLRKFRDEHMRDTGLGSSLIGFYYRNSPPVADLIASSRTLRAAARLAIAPIVYGMKHPGLLLMALCMTAIPALRRRTH